MGINVSFARAGVLGIAATAAITLNATVVSAHSPRIMLADNTVAVDPPRWPRVTARWATGRSSPRSMSRTRRSGGLDPALLSAIQAAATAASADGITMTITSGWRSPEFQERLLNDAVATYGSMAAARQYVQTPEGSKHVIGEAVDVGGVGADQWLIANGARFGLCRIYANELWHFELATDAAGNCPPLLPNAAG